MLPRMRAFAAAVCLIALLAACHRGDRAVPSQAAAALLENRNWMDRWPTSKDDRIHVYRFTPAMGGGVYQDRTLFRGTFELFTYQVHGDVIEIRFPDTGTIARTRFHISRVNGPPPFDLRLTFDHSARGPRILFGRSEETGHASSWLNRPPPGRSHRR